MSQNTTGDDPAGSRTTISSSTAGRKNIPGKRSDIGWKHGVDILGNGKKVKCNYCSKIVQGIFRFKAHLAGSGDDAGACPTVPEEVKKLMIRIVAEGKEASKKKRRLNVFDEEEAEIQEIENRSSLQGRPDFPKGKGKAGSRPSGGVQATINQMMKKGIKEEADQRVAEFFYTSAIPFNCIKNPAFANMCEAIGKYGIGYKPPSYHDIREKLLKQMVEQTDETLEEFKEEWKITGCSIMSDGWTDKKRRSIVNFLVNIPKGTVFLYSLDTSDISKTTDKVFKMLDDIVTFVGEEHVVQVVTDNAANYKAAGEMLMLTRKNLYWTPCAAHCIDLIFEDFEKHLKVHQVTIKKGRRITTYIYSRTMLISILKQFTNGRDLIRPGATRFATSYLTLSCLNDNKASLMSMFSSDDWKKSRFASTEDGKKVANMILDNRFWKNIVICLKAAVPLIVVLRMVDSDEKPAMGFIYEGMDCAKEKIRSNFNNIKKSYEPVWKIIDQRWDNQLHRPLHAAAYYVNPQLHYEPNFHGDDLEVTEGLMACLVRMVSDSVERRKIHAQMVDFHLRKGLFGHPDARASRKNMSLAEWWMMYGGGHKELKRFAIRVLSLTCSSSGCERNWSSFEMVHTKKRNRLHQQKMNDLVYVMYNLKLKSRSTRKSVTLPFEDMPSDDEWITEDGNEDANEVNVEQADGPNVVLDGSSSNPSVNFEGNVEEHFSSGAEFDDDGDECDDDDDDDGDHTNEDGDHTNEDEDENAGGLDMD